MNRLRSDESYHWSWEELLGPLYLSRSTPLNEINVYFLLLIHLNASFSFHVMIKKTWSLGPWIIICKLNINFQLILHIDLILKLIISAMRYFIKFWLSMFRFWNHRIWIYRIIIAILLDSSILMLFKMIIKMSLSWKRFLAPSNITMVRFFSSMDSEMSLKISFFVKWPPALFIWANISFLSCVSFQMNF